MLAYLDAKIVQGAEALLNLMHFDETLHNATLVVTGEGCLDSQSQHGKVISAVAKHANKYHVPTYALVGRAAPHIKPHALGLSDVISTVGWDVQKDEALRHARQNYKRAAYEFFHNLKKSLR